MYDGAMESHDSMPPASNQVRLTYDDLLLLPDDGQRHEIVDGVHYVTPSPNTRHQLLVGRLYFEIESYLRQHPGTGRVFLSPFDVLFTRWDVVEPDLLFVASDQDEILTDKNVQGPPALVVEILSRGTRKRDEHVKRRLYDRCGVREYWIVDPDLGLVKVFRRLPDGSFPQVAELAREDPDPLTTPLLPGLELRLDEVLAEI